MRFKDISGKLLESKEFAGGYKSAEKLFAFRFGQNELFIPRFLSATVIPYRLLKYAYLETEYVECLTSEFPAEYNVHRLFFYLEDESFAKAGVDSHVIAERLLAKLLQKAPHVEIRPEKLILEKGAAKRH